MPIYGLYYSTMVHLFTGIYVRKLSKFIFTFEKNVSEIFACVMIISPSFLSIEEYMVMIPFEIELIKKIETIEKIKLRYMSKVFSLLAIKAFIA